MIYRPKMIRNRQVPTEQDLAALADGSLPAARRVKVERAVAASPELQATVAAQRRALAAIDAAAGEQAPAALRARLELLRGPRRRRRGTWASLPRLVPAGAVAIAAVVAVLVLTLGGGVSAPTVAQAAVLGTRSATAPAPAQHGATPTLAHLTAAGLPFPYWDDRFGFSAVGVRHDRFDGRPATTVFYRSRGQRVAYTIVSGPPLRFGARTHRSVWNGIAMWTLEAHGMRVATWLRRGHSCVLSGQHVSFYVLNSLGSWRGGGKIPY